MSNEGQAPHEGGYPPHGAPTSGAQPASYPPAHGGPAAQAPQPGQYAPQPGQHSPQQGHYGAPGGYAPQPGQYAAPGQPGAQQPAAPRPNPFAGIPAADFVRDGVAALLLLVSLALPVTIGTGYEGVSDRFHYVVILAAVVSIVSLALPYLARANVFPPSWTVHTTRLVRLLANAPYVVVLLVYVVLDALTNDDVQGVGTTFALGLAGAVLAAQPRQCEMGPEDQDRAVSVLWWRITAGIGAFIALTSVVSLVLFLIDAGDYADIGFLYVVGPIVAWLLTVAFSLWAIFGTVVQRSSSWRLTLIGLGTVLVCAFVFGAGDDASLVKVQSMHQVAGAFVYPLSLMTGLGAIFVPAAAAAAAAPATVRALSREPREQIWFGTAIHALEYLLVVAGSAVVGAVLWMFLEENGLYGGDKPTGAIVTTIILGLIIAAGAVYARMELTKNTAGGRIPALAVAGGTFVLGLVILIVAPTEQYRDMKFVTVGHLLLAFGLPAMIAIALTGPKAVREYFAANRPAPRTVNDSAYQWTAPQAQAPGYQQAPQQPYQQQAPTTGAWQTQQAPPPSAPAPQAPAAPTTDGAPSHGYTAAQAADPATPPAVLADIVQHAPELRAQVAGNPTTYPALVDWLAQLGDPDVDAALRKRKG
ncbi:proline-rich domain-containing protein [Sanguibacter suaedae]|uniref:Uncharacterized protein n=1 Tax=Sanguibacter suaedae TaxID=2795737 RepID=A0A934M6K6_9MICO|nr:proline-rich domain-containing protein [Sanguibacter suaedae]MBI9114357.1 hypothetical protein [Sanguibacter suaedae]